MLTVQVNQLATTSDSLQVGLVVRYGDDGPVRFARAYIEDATLDWQTLSDLQAWLTRNFNRHLDSEHESAEPTDLPLF